MQNSRGFTYFYTLHILHRGCHILRKKQCLLIGFLKPFDIKLFWWIFNLFFNFIIIMITNNILFFILELKKIAIKFKLINREIFSGLSSGCKRPPWNPFIYWIWSRRQNNRKSLHLGKWFLTWIVKTRPNAHQNKKSKKFSPEFFFYWWRWWWCRDDLNTFYSSNSFQFVCNDARLCKIKWSWFDSEIHFEANQTRE